MSTDTGPIDRETVVSQLRRAGVLPNDATPTIAPLGGGVSNAVLKVEWSDGCVVVKRPRANLAVEADWPADIDRVHNEAAAIRAYQDVIESTGISARVPAVRMESRHAHMIALACAPPDARMWKRDLLAGRVDAAVADAVGTALGTVHRVTAADTDLADRFAGDRPFDQLRLDPYHRTVARRHDDVAGIIDAEVERIRAVGRTLVHGDFSPKNVLVVPSEPARPWVLDFEVAHWGDPAFDPAFMLNHLLIKSLYNHARQPTYIDAARRFWSAYDTAVEWNGEGDTVVELGILMLARVDGKSPVEYLDGGPIAQACRHVAKRALLGPVRDLDGYIALVERAGSKL